MKHTSGIMPIEIGTEAKRAVLLLAHGTPDELSDVPKYLSNVVSGRPMPASVIDEITHRYGLIGKSPLTTLTLEQGRLLSDALGLPVYVGMRNWKPYIVDTVKRMKDDGITEAVAICLAPQNSRTSVGLYRRAVVAEAGDALRIDFIEGWADHPKLIQAFAAKLEPVLNRMSQETGAAPAVLFTAHSVPCRTIQTPAANTPAPSAWQPPIAAQPPGATSASPLTWPSNANQSEAEEQRKAVVVSEAEVQTAHTAQTRPEERSVPREVASTQLDSWVRSSADQPASAGRSSLAPDPYPVDAKRTAALVAAHVPGLSEDGWYFAFQSQGMAGGPWLGPSVENTLIALHAEGVRAVVLHTIGFLCDHVEILYDIDIAFRAYAANLGMRLERPASLNDSPLLTQALVDLAQGGLARLAAAHPESALAEAR